MSRVVNLWNVGSGRTRLVLEFVEGLWPKKRFGLNDVVRFDRIKARALGDGLSCDERLRIIGYLPRREPKIFDWSEE